MADEDHYSRLVTFIVEGCPEPQRELFLQKAKADRRPGVQYTTLDAYLNFHRQTIHQMVQRKHINSSQLSHIFPLHGCADIQEWDVTLVSSLLQGLFYPLPHNEQTYIDKIRDVRNQLYHKASVDHIKDREFTVAWDILEKATSDLAGCVNDPNCKKQTDAYIDELKYKPLPASVFDILNQMNAVLKTDIKEDVRNAKETAIAATRLIKPATVTKCNRSAFLCMSTNDASSSSSSVSSPLYRVDEEHSGVITRSDTCSKQIQLEQIGKRFNAEYNPNLKRKVNENHDVYVRDTKKQMKEKARNEFRYAPHEMMENKIKPKASQCTTNNDASSSTMSSHIDRMDEEHSGVITRYGSKQIQPEQIGKRFNAEYDETNSSMSSPIKELDKDNTGVITRSGSKVKQPHLTRKRFNAKIIKLSRKQHKKKKKKQVQDDLTWEMCMNTRSLKGARRLLKRGHLPVWKTFKHFYTDASCKNIFFLACQHISKRIKATSDNILQVYPAYRVDDTESIVFVVITKVESDNVVPEDYPVMCRCVDEYSNEGQDITNYRLSNNIYLTEEEAAKLQECIQKNSEKLMREHSNLTMISGCPCKSANYGDKQELIKETCIVLYVRVKGLIPISEEQFKTHINGIRVDVREGGFRFYGGAKTRQDRLCVGCQISSSMTGTLGMFMDYKNTTCCVTSAHVVLDDASMKDLISNSHKEWKIDEAPKVFQPHSTDCKDIFGHVIQAWYRSGEENKAGTEIALIAIENRHPISGRFPEQEGTDENSKLQFSSGQICVRSQSLGGSEVLMFGSETEKITRGRVLINVTDIRYEDLHLISDYKFPLKNQIVIDDLPNQVFAKPGDSGAVVFMKFQEIGSGPELKALGIFEGKTRDNRYLVTPIWDILEVLSHPQITNFRTSSLEEQITKLERTMNQRFEKLENLIVQGTSQNNC